MKRLLLIFLLLLLALPLCHAQRSMWWGAVKQPSAVPIATNLTAGLLVWWTFDTARTSTGTNNVLDSSGFGNDATLTGACTQTNGMISTATFFESGNYASIATKASLSLTNSASMMAWVYHYTSPSVNSRFLTLGAANVGWIGLNASSETTALIYDGVNQSVSDGVAVSAYNGQWRHIAATWNSTNMFLYTNGILANSATCGKVNYDGLDSRIVTAASAGGTLTLLGTIDDARIYTNCLSAAEIQYIYTNGLSGHWIP